MSQERQDKELQDKVNAMSMGDLANQRIAIIDLYVQLFPSNYKSKLKSNKEIKMINKRIREFKDKNRL